MDLIESEPNETGPLPEPEPRYQPVAAVPTKTEHGQTWLNTLVTILVGVILVVLIVLFARWVYHKVNNNETAEPTSGTLKVSTESSNTSKESSESGTRPSSSQSTNNSSSRTSSSSTTSTSTTDEQLPNSGPGDVAALFVAASFAAASLHYVISLRKANKLT